jgi:hypothetical protein
MKRQLFILLLAVITVTKIGYAQNNNSEPTIEPADPISSEVSSDLHKLDHKNSHSMQGTHRITLGLGHTNVSEGKINDKTEWLSMPPWSLNYDYWISDKIAIGLQNDIIVESFKITDHEEEEIERHYPLTTVPVVIYKPFKNFSFIGGVGAEFSGGHTLWLTRLGTEFGFHIPGNWEGGAALVWDGKWDHYNSYGIAFTFSKLFR